jgi:hypothetical protein
MDAGSGNIEEREPLPRSFALALRPYIAAPAVVGERSVAETVENGVKRTVEESEVSSPVLQLMRYLD